MTILGLIDPIRNPQPWATLAACAQPGVDIEAFFPERGGSPRDAKLICWGCRVRPICLADAVAQRDKNGVRGGFTEDERKPMKLGSLPSMPPVKCSRGHNLAVVGLDSRQGCKECGRERGRRERVVRKLRRPL
jgi:hypothetical protein